MILYDLFFSFTPQSLPPMSTESNPSDVIEFESEDPPESEFSDPTESEPSNSPTIEKRSASLRVVQR